VTSYAAKVAKQEISIEQITISQKTTRPSCVVRRAKQQDGRKHDILFVDMKIQGEIESAIPEGMGRFEQENTWAEVPWTCASTKSMI
jgi:hypothetical protein